MKLSVVIPVHNAENYLEQCLKSIISQNIHDIEIICINDGSTDNSLSILEQFAEKYKFIKIITQRNLGAGAARNAGIDNAKGEYIYFMDADDYLEKSALKNLLHSIEKYNADICIGNYTSFDNESGKIRYKVKTPAFIKKEISHFSKFDYMQNFFQITDSNVWTKLFKISLIKEKNIRFSETKSANDIFFNYAALFNAQKIVYCRKNIINYRSNLKSSLTLTNLNENIKNCFKNYNELYKYLKKQNTPQALKISLTQRLISSVSYYLKIASDNNNFRAIADEIKTYKDWLDDELLDNKEFTKNYFANNKISVVLPVYNVENYLEQCLNSLVNQTYKNIEIICVNDGSTDNSAAILEKFAQEDNRIKIINIPNSGISIARNKGIEASTGDYILFVDSDDWCESNYIEQMYKNIFAYNTDFHTCAISLFDNSTGIYSEEVYYSLQDLKKLANTPLTFDDTKKILFRFPVMAWGKIIRTQLLKENRILFQEKMFFEDNAFFFDLVLNCRNFSLSLDQLYIYRVNRKGSCIFSKDEKYLDLIKIYKYIKSGLAASLKFKEVKKLYWKHVWKDFYIRFKQIDLSLKPVLYKNFAEFLKENYEKGANKDIDIFMSKMTYEKLLNKIEDKKSFLQKIFSLKNSGDYKIITILGFEIKKNRFKK